MSRIIVKNLPKKVKEDRLRNIFGKDGISITDVQLKYSKDGVFRQFAFIGFKHVEDAKNAIQFHDKTFIDTSRIKVELCAELGDSENKPRSWSKYSKDSSKFSEKNQKKNEEKLKSKKDVEESSDKNPINDIENDPEFKEFMDVHRNATDQQIWNNDGVVQGDDIKEESSDDSSDENEESESGNADGNQTENVAEKKVSDFEYLKSKKLKDDDFEESIKKKDKGKKLELDIKFTVKLRNLPYRCKKKEIKDFFEPHKPKSLRMPRKVKGIAYALFKTEKAFKAALSKHRSILGGHRIDVIKYIQKEIHEVTEETVKSKKPWEEKTEENSKEDSETVAESGRLFVRNLAYSCSEDDLESLFKPYGPLSEVNLPIDKFTRKVKGFGFITYMIPEHAVKACAELDGTSFQGRILHLLPSKIKASHNDEDVNKAGSSFKKKQAEKTKANSSSSHNWNSLFLGANAVVDVMSHKYNASKSEILDSEGRGSMAVRVALGETQIVNETRDFLLNNGVNLDEFSQPASERSKVVIIAKNLPSLTTTKELRVLFSKFGVVKNVLFPPSGITALIEMEEPSEARAAFRRLAYSKFHDLPLYLEWAPMKVFKEDRKSIVVTEPTESANEDIAEVEPDTDANIFVKNLNFSTDEESLRAHFETIGKVHSVIVMKKKKLKDSDEYTNLSMGYGFVHFYEKEDAQRAIRELQQSMLDDHAIELKLSNRATQSGDVNSTRKKANKTKQQSSKILVRNIPFEARKSEVEELFKVFGELRAVRLPKKVTGSHRGFAFVDYISKNDALRAFKAMCHSTHLYGRRLVLEWAESEEDVNEIRKKTADHFFQDGPQSKKMKKAFVDDADIVNKGADFENAEYA